MGVVLLTDQSRRCPSPAGLQLSEGRVVIANKKGCPAPLPPSSLLLHACMVRLLQEGLSAHLITTDQADALPVGLSQQRVPDAAPAAPPAAGSADSDQPAQAQQVSAATLPDSTDGLASTASGSTDLQRPQTPPPPAPPRAPKATRTEAASAEEVRPLPPCVCSSHTATLWLALDVQTPPP